MATEITWGGKTIWGKNGPSTPREEVPVNDSPPIIGVNYLHSKITEESNCQRSLTVEMMNDNDKKELVQSEFTFLEHTVIAVWHADQWYFSPRRFCENWGIAWQGQQQRIRNNVDKYNCQDILTVGKDGKQRKMLLIPASRANTWVMDIEIGKVKKSARPILQKYRDELSDWLYARDFLTREEIQAVENVAIERGAVIRRLSLEEKRDTVLCLPSEFSDYKKERVVLITDAMIGLTDPAKLGNPYPLTKHNFYLEWMVGGYCADKMVILHPEFETAWDVEEYARMHSMHRGELYTLPLSFTLMAQLTKANKMFDRSIPELVLQYNMPAESIRYSINYIQYWLAEYFAHRQVALPETIRATQGAVYKSYMADPLWHKKRDAYFSVYNCCVDCPPELGFDIVSRNFRPHHLHYHTVGKEHPDDLVPLCDKCHGEREKKREG